MFWQLYVSLHCVEKPDKIADISISKSSIQRHGLTLATYFQKKTKNMLQKVASVSLMFDEASDIQMYKHLHIFVNVSSYNWSFS